MRYLTPHTSNGFSWSDIQNSKKKANKTTNIFVYSWHDKVFLIGKNTLKDEWNYIRLTSGVLETFSTKVSFMIRTFFTIFYVFILIMDYPLMYCSRGKENLNCECGYFKNDFDVTFWLHDDNWNKDLNNFYLGKQSLWDK